MKKIINILFCCFLFTGLFAQPSDCVPPNSGINATIIIDADTELFLDNQPLPIGTHIVVLFSDNNQLRCGGYTTWDGNPTGLSAVGGSTGFSGFSEEETYQFRLELPNGTIIPPENIEASFKSPDGVFCLNGNQFGADGISCLESLHAVRQLPYFSLNADTLFFEKEGDTQNFALDGNVSWQISHQPSGENWLNYSPTSGDTASIISLEVSENTNTGEREAMLLFEVDGFSNDTIYIIQEGKTSSVSEAIDVDLIKVFPNPCRNFLVIENLDTNNLIVEGIIDQTGKMLVSDQVIIPAESRFTLSLPNLPAGQYYLQTRNEKEEFIFLTFKKL